MISQSIIELLSYYTTEPEKVEWITDAAPL